MASMTLGYQIIILFWKISCLFINMEYSKIFFILLIRIFSFFEFVLGWNLNVCVKIIEFMSKLPVKVPQNSNTLHSHTNLTSSSLSEEYDVTLSKSLQVGCCTSLFFRWPTFLGCTIFGGGYPTMNLDQHVSRWWNLSLNQCWAVLSFWVRTGRFRFFHDVRGTWLVLYIYIYI